MPIFELTADALRPLEEVRFADRGITERGDLQRVLRDQIDVIAPDTLVVAEEFADWDESRRRIDLLGVDRQGNLVVIELKRTEDGGHMDLQAIRYAAMVSTMTFDRVAEVFQAYLNGRGQEEDARQVLLDFLGWDEPADDRFAQDVRIVLVSAEFSKEVTTAVLWLNQRDLDVRCVRLRPQRLEGRTLLDVQQIIPLPEASAYLVGVRQKSAEQRAARRAADDWGGVWFVNLGMNAPDDAATDAEDRPYHRHWDLCRRHGYVAAGGGLKYSQPLRKLKVGNPVAVYQKKAGYLGYGVVTREAAPFHLARLADGRTLAEATGCGHVNADGEEEQWEWAVGVEWKKVVPLDQAVTFANVFANQNVVCKLRDKATLAVLRERLGVPGDGAGPRGAEG